MILAGAWAVLLGYGLLYAGVAKLGGSTCGLRAAFTRAGCQPGQSPTGAALSVNPPGVTQAAAVQAQAQQQNVLLPGTAIV